LCGRRKVRLKKVEEERKFRVGDGAFKVERLGRGEESTEKKVGSERGEN
jgi:hypothetical protein